MVKMLRGAVLGLAVLGLLSSCSGQDGPALQLRSITLEEVGRIGSQMDGPEAFTWIAGVLPTASEIFVLERNPPRVAVFDSSGQWLRDFGRAGDGPGELQRPSEIGRSGDLVWIGDPWGGRVEFFDRSGQPVRSVRWRIEPDSLGAFQVPTFVLADGSILAGPVPLSVGAAVRGVLQHRDYSTATEEGTIQSELYVQAVVPGDFFATDRVLGGHPLMQSPLVDFYPDGSGIAVAERYEATAADSAAYRLLSIAPDGSRRFDLTVPYEPVSAEGWLEHYVSIRERDMLERSGSIERELLAGVAEALDDRSFYPPTTELVAGTDGSTWVRREETVTDSVQWAVFDTSGRRIARATTAKDLRIVAASWEEVWAVEQDQLDVPFLLRMKVEVNRPAP